MYVLKPMLFWSQFLFEKSGSTGPVSARPEDGRGGARTGLVARLTIGCIVLGAAGGIGGAGAPAMRPRATERALGGR